MDCLAALVAVQVRCMRRSLDRWLDGSLVHWLGLLCVGVTASCILTGRPLPSLVVFSLALFTTHRYTTMVLRNRRRPVDWARLLDSCADPVRKFFHAAVYGSLGVQQPNDAEVAAGTTTTTTTTTVSCDRKADVGGIDDASVVTAVNNSVLSELDVLLQHITRDFILNWYQQFSSNEQFSREIHYALEDLTVALVSRVRKLRSGGLQTLVRRLIRTFHRYFIGYLRALARAEEAARQQPNNTRMDVPHFFDEWHYAMPPSSESSVTELRHLHNLVDLALEVLVPADVLCCPLGRRLVLSLIADSLLLPMVDLFSSPDWINKQLVVLLNGTEDPSEDASVCYTCVPEYRNLNIVEADVKQLAASQDQSDVGKAGGVEGSLSKDNNSNDSNSAATSATNCEARLNLSCQAGSVDGIWRRIADKTPAAFRTERQHEISEILQKKKTLKLPVSTSFDKLSDMFSNTITGNLAHYFRMTLDDDPIEDVDGGASAASSSPSVSRQSSGQSPSSQELGEEVDDGDHHKVSSVLGRFLPVTTGPVLADHLWGLGHKGLRMREAVNNCISSVVRERRSSVTSSNASSTTSDEKEQDDSIQQRSPSERIVASHGGSPQPEVSQIQSVSSGVVVASSKAEDKELTLCDTPTFANLSIPRSEIVEEGSSGAQYVVYRIQYDAWYRNSPSEIAENDVEAEETTEAEEPFQHAVLMTRIVRRRFREFETLHSCLEEDPQLRPLLRGVKGPNKWSVLPFSKLDSEAIGERRMALELYLQILISKKPLANSRQLKDFLAYGSDASIAYVRKSTSDLPRLDKFLMKTVSGMFDKLKTALPSLPVDPAVSDPSNDVDATASGGIDIPAQQQKTSDRLLGFLNFNSPVINTNEDDSPQLRLSFDFSTEPLSCSRNVEEMLSCFLVNHDVNYDKVDAAADAAVWQQDFWNPLSSLSEAGMAFRRPSDTSPSVEILAKVQQQLGQLEEEGDDESADQGIDETIPLASAVIDFSVETIVGNDGVLIDREPFVSIAKIIFGQLLERYLEQLVDNLTTEAMFTHYVRLVRESIWPNGVYAPQPEVRLTDAQKVKLYELTLKTLKDYFPGAIVAVFGRSQYDRGMKLFLDSLQHPKLLRHLVYQLLDILVDVLLVRSRSQSIMEKLSSSYGLS